MGKQPNFYLFLMASGRSRGQEFIIGSLLPGSVGTANGPNLLAFGPLSFDRVLPSRDQGADLKGWVWLNDSTYSARGAKGEWPHHYWLDMDNR
jgi:hypothetical protein